MPIETTDLKHRSHKVQKVRVINPLTISSSGESGSSTALDLNPNYFDPFSRLRVSQANLLFDGQLTYDLQPLLFDQDTTANAAIAHDSDNRCATMTLTSAVDTNSARMRTFEHFRYKAGNGQLAFITFNMNGGTANTQKIAGLSTGSNGIEFLMDGTTPTFRILSDTDLGDESVTQANWNIDTLLDGTGPSGKTIDFTKTQILVIDFQALYVGRVRIGFDIDGVIVYCHEFNHANDAADPYVQTANLPINVELKATDAVTSATMEYICSTVITEGGTADDFAYHFSEEGTVTAASGTDTHILSIEPTLTFNSIENRIKIVPTSLDIVVTGNNPVLWKLCVGQALTTPSATAVNSTYSGVQSTTGTLSGDPAIVIAQGYVAATNQNKSSINQETLIKYPITLDADGALRDLGRLTVLVQGIGGTSATRAILNWDEIR